ncbi:hypothetical protein IAT38_007948 [Cryptococcus sp. DSM 104549]
MSAPPPSGGAAPTSPRSPRIRPSTPAGTVPTAPTGAPVPLDLNAGSFNPQPPRPNFSSMLFLTAFFFFMSGGNNVPVSGGVEIGPDGEVRPRVTELEYVRGIRDEWRGWVNGTGAEGNYTEPEIPQILPSTLLPPHYVHPPTSPFYTNITGFYRHATVHPLSLTAPIDAPSHESLASFSSFWKGATLPPSLNSTAGWNETRAEEMRGEWDWAGTYRWDMNIKERNVSAALDGVPGLSNATAGLGDVDELYENWTWIKGSLTLTSRPSAPTEGSSTDDKTMVYDFLGVHYLPNGTYNMYALPEGMRMDIRKLPGLWGAKLGSGEVVEATRGIIMRELEKEVRVQEEMFVLGDVRPDDVSKVTTCPLLIHLALPPIPPHVHPSAVSSYLSELSHPTGILSSIPAPPLYWQAGSGPALIAVADTCGWALGVSSGKGIPIDTFWRSSISYAFYATLSQLVVLVLLVRQMESTRTPSTLAKVSLWGVVIMSVSDSWVFSAHVVLGIMSDNRASLPMLVPGFLCLCTAVVFGPRYAVLLHRMQAPERASAPAPPPRLPGAAGAAGGAAGPGGATANGAAAPPAGESESRIRSAWQFISTLFENYPGLRWVAGIITLFILLPFIFLPSVVPFLLFALYSFWIPQIWRNARRGSTRALERVFVLGTSAGRLALPLYAFAYEDNVFFIEKQGWVWGLALWQAVQIGVMFAQERLGPAFFLPKSMQPPESYNYHPSIPLPDPENPSPFGPSPTCSICYEEVDLHPHHHHPSGARSRSHSPSASTSGAGAGASGSGAGQGQGLLGLGDLGLGDKRRSYAVAPCGHVFHTKCLAQWMGIKTICPLCKRSLPPL